MILQKTLPPPSAMNSSALVPVITAPAVLSLLIGTDTHPLKKQLAGHTPRRPVTVQAFKHLPGEALSPLFSGTKHSSQALVLGSLHSGIDAKAWERGPGYTPAGLQSPHRNEEAHTHKHTTPFPHIHTNVYHRDPHIHTTHRHIYNTHAYTYTQYSHIHTMHPFTENLHTTHTLHAYTHAWIYFWKSVPL